MTKRQNPTEPAVDSTGRSRGGFADIARRLNDLYPPAEGQRPISRQLVHKWYEHRTSNGFPEATGLRGSSGGRGYPEFNEEAVVNWYVDYRKTRLKGGSLTRACIPGTPGKSLPLHDQGEGSLAA